MAYSQITKNKKGMLVAKIQASGKDPTTGEGKVYSKRVYNEDHLTEAKFRKYVDKIGAEFELEIQAAYEAGAQVIHTRIFTFSELLAEWAESVKQSLSYTYYKKILKTGELFQAFLEERRLGKAPITEIKVRDIQMFLNRFSDNGAERKDTVVLKKKLPSVVSLRELEREGIATRCSTYNLCHKQSGILRLTALEICNRYKLSFEEYFETREHRAYSVETIKGHRRILRTLFNEAVRYEWIDRNPVAGTKVGAGNANSSLKPVKEKEVFSFTEAQLFLRNLDVLPDEAVNRKIVLKFMILTGVRTAEMCGLRWSDIDYEKKVVHIRRNRLYAKELGYYEKEPKTKTSIRDIPLPDPLIQDLRDFEQWFRIADTDFDLKRDEYYVASNIYRCPIANETIASWLRKYEKDWALKYVSCHGLRHTYCSLLLSQNVPIQTVSKYMGHSDSTVTLKVYSHFIPDTQEKAIFALNNLLT